MKAIFLIAPLVLFGCASPAPKPYAVAVWKVPAKSEKLNDIAKQKKPAFVKPATPGASSCLIPGEEQILLDLLAKLAANDAAWRAWYEQLQKEVGNGSNPGN